ncbi:PKD domain-containing protein [uncultured Methanoregula sp.]|uniref:PKD domain-containing protein n=1 Tax=uncultured Methanoregula sp. TaxID=1005933 RepID=UPI002AABFB14|nr:PKD domain-containing protein [uncultured Methanoregula sp.]
MSTAPVAAITPAAIATSTPAPEFPAISFSGTPISGTAPLNVQFEVSTSGSPTSWSWDFGDGGSSTERDPSYSYVIPGTYTVTLTAKYPYGNKPVTKSSYITVTAGSHSTSSPIPPLIPLGAIGIAGFILIAGRKRL